MEAFRGVLFDVDGVLLDTRTLRRKCHKAALQAVCGVGDVSFGSDVPWGYGVKSQLTDLLKRHDCLSKSNLDEALSVWTRLYERYHAELATPLPGIPELLKELDRASFPFGVVTNRTADRLELAFRRLPALDQAACALSVDDVGAGKPHPEAITLGLHMMELDASAVLFAGDTSADAAAAGSAGVRFILCSNRITKANAQKMKFLIGCVGKASDVSDAIRHFIFGQPSPRSLMLFDWKRNDSGGSANR